MPECPLCKGAGVVVFRDGVPEESRGRQSEEHMEDKCPACGGVPREIFLADWFDRITPMPPAQRVMTLTASDKILIAAALRKSVEPEIGASALLDALLGKIQLDNIDPNSLTIGEIRRAI
jgi:hypothetical protein